MLFFYFFILFLVMSNTWFIFPLLGSAELIFSSDTNKKTYSNGNRQHRPCHFVCEARFIFPNIHYFIPKELSLLFFFPLDLLIPLLCANMVISLLTTFFRSLMSMLNIMNPSFCGISVATFLFMKCNDFFHFFSYFLTIYLPHLRTCLFCCLVSLQVFCARPYEKPSENPSRIYWVYCPYPQAFWTQRFVR